MNYILRILILTIIVFPVAATAGVLKGTILDSSDNSPLIACSVAINPGNSGFATDIDGCFSIRLKPGTYTLKASYVGFDEAVRKITIGSADTSIVIKMTPVQSALKEITVTARESSGATTSSRIDRAAMTHLQPSSFTDLLELVPGNVSQDPAMGSVNSIKLRETGNLGATGESSDNGDYAIGSLGTLFNVDGAPINNDASMQSVGIEANTGRNSVNRGVDMRTLSTDNIESVEIIRGIPSAEYGNLSSGMVNIRRSRKATPFSARFKADGFSKLFFAGKGVAFGQNTLNADVSWLDSKVDPRDNLENYKRITASVRAALHFSKPGLITDWNLSGDFTSTVDKAESDPDLSLMKIDSYKSTYDRGSFISSLNFTFPSLKWLGNVQLDFSGSYGKESLRRQRQVAPSRASVAPISTTEGIADGAFLLGEYIADYLSEGKPLTLFGKVKAKGKINALGIMTHEYLAGAEWNMSKNYGRGQVYDPYRPLSASWTSRPRPYSEIPALNVVGAYIENAMTITAGRNSLELQAGMHLTALAGLDKRYLLAGKPYIDPRLNAVWHFPDTRIAGHNASFLLAAGYGLNTRMPTADYLFPQKAYLDIIQLNYYDTSNPEELSRVNLRTYINDATNYELRAARNAKWEVRLGADIGRNKFSITYFQEKMNSGFRYATVYAAYDYRSYDASGIIPGTLTVPPDLATLPFADASVLRGYRKAENGTRIDKQGIEFQLNTARWKPLATALTVTGAWFRTRYSNSAMLYEPVSDVIGNTAVSDKYVGLYDTADGRINNQFNTNFMFDTQIPKLGLVFTTTFQCMWFVKTRRLAENGTPVAYISAADGLLHDFDSALAASDPMLNALIRYYNPDLYNNYTIPTAVYVNFKATKTIGKYMRMALFVNRILDYLPDYTSNGLTIRRSADAYFGMEINLTI